jgi:hypothetical protein
MNQAENIIQNLGVVRLLLKPNQLIVDRVQALAGLGQKLAQQIIHETGLTQLRARDIAAPLDFASFYGNGLILVEHSEKNGLNKEIRQLQ